MLRPQNRPNDILSNYKITKANRILAGSPDHELRTIFAYKQEIGTNPYDNSNPFRSVEALARQAIWEAGFYAEWKEGNNGLLEPTKFRGEEVITKVILELADRSKNKKVAYFTKGHGEASPSDANPKDGNSVFRDLMEDRNIAVSSIDLSVVERVPLDASLLVVSGPKAVFQDKEVAMIRNFIIHEGGSLLLAIDPTEDLSLSDYPAFGFRPVLKEWGLRCHDMLIHDPVKENFDLFSGSYFLKTYLKDGTHPLVKNIMNEGISILTGPCRPVEKDKQTRSNFLPQELLFHPETLGQLLVGLSVPYPLRKTHSLIYLDRYQYLPFQHQIPTKFPILVSLLLQKYLYWVRLVFYQMINSEMLQEIKPLHETSFTGWTKIIKCWISLQRNFNFIILICPQKTSDHYSTTLALFLDL